MTFKEYITNQPMHEIIDWITDEDDNIIVDTIIRYEDNIETKIKEFLSKQEIKFPKEFEYKNKSVKRIKSSYRDYYDDETINMVNELQKKTIERFGYKF